MINSEKWNLKTAKYVLRQMKEIGISEFNYNLNKEQVVKAILNFDNVCSLHNSLYNAAYESVIKMERTKL